MLKNLPNFLLVGAAKSGSSSLFHYIKEHPDIFAPVKKEPSYFILEKIKNTNPNDKVFQMNKNGFDYTFDKYLALYNDIGNEKIVLDASAHYLYNYKLAIPKIKEILGDPFILIILRNPVDKAFSHYKNLRKWGVENIPFEEALKLEKKRINEDFVDLYHYTSQGFYYAQVKSYLENFTKVKIVLYDDLVKNPIDTIQEIFRFLNIKDNVVPSNIHKKYYVSNIIKYPTLSKILKLIYGSRVNGKLQTVLQKKILNKVKLTFRKKLYRKLILDKNTRNKLIGIFYDDILRTQSLLERDLSSWLR